MKKGLLIALVAALLFWVMPASALAFPFPVGKAATKVSIAPSKLTISDGTTRRLAVRVSPAQPGGKVVWTVEAASQVASVDEEGLVTALMPGSCYVRATDLASGVFARCRVTVRTVKVTGLRLSRTSLALKPGDVYKELTCTIAPANASIKQATWSSNNPSVVAVDAQTGQLTAVGSGAATITCKAGSKKATCKVKVVGKHASFTLSAVGDVVMGGDPEPKSALNRSTEQAFAQLIAQYGPDYPFKNVQQVFKSDDVTIVNLECALTTRAAGRDKPHVLRGELSYAGILKNAGVDVCNLANNHTRDFGTAGYKSTKDALTSAGITFGGFTEDGYYTMTKNGVSVRVGFAGFQTAVSEASVRARVKLLKKRCDVAVVSFHWCDTTEWVAKNFASDTRMAYAAIQAGADLVLGSHRHVPAGIEQYRGKYIVYDLSNFAVGIKHKSENGRPLTDSMIFQWNFVVDETGYVADEGIRVIPCATTLSTDTYPATDEFGNLGAPINNWQPAILTGQAGRDVIARIQKLSNITVPMG